MNLFEHWDKDRALSTMQRLRDANTQLRRQITRDRVVFWAFLVAVITVSLLTHRGVI